MSRWIFWALLGICAPAFGEVQWEKTVQNFQRTAADEAVTAVFRFQNTGPGAVRIAGITPSCTRCTTVEADRQKPYAPGERGTVKMIFTFGERTGAQKSTAALHFSDGSEATLELRVLIEEALLVRPRLLYWRKGEPATPRELHLTVQAGHSVQILAVRCSSPTLRVEPARPVAPGEQVIVVTPLSTAQPLTATLTVQTDDPPDAPRAYTIYARIK